MQKVILIAREPVDREVLAVSYRAGVVGLSPIGQQHLAAFESTPGIEVVAVAELDEELLQDQGSEWDIPAPDRYVSYADMLASVDLDVLSVVTPSFLHRDHVMAAVDSVASPEIIWVEKPIATSVTAAEEMVDACSADDVELVVNHTRRFGDPYRALRELVSDGSVLGEIRAIHMSAPEELLRNGTHYIDLIHYLLGDPFDWASGFLTESSERMGTEFDDCGGAGMLQTADDVYVHVDCTVPRGLHDGTWTLVGTAGKLHIDPVNDVTRYWRTEDDPSAPYDLAQVETELSMDLTGFGDADAMFQNAAVHMCEVLEGTRSNLSPGHEAAHVLEAIVGLFVSHFTQSRVELPLNRPLRDVRIRSR